MGRVVEVAPGGAALGARGPCASGSTSTACIADRSMTTPSSARAEARARCGPPPRTARARPALAGEVHGRHHVAGVGAADDHARAPVDHRVVDLARLVVPGVVGGEDLASHLVAENAPSRPSPSLSSSEPWSGHSYYAGPSKETLRAANPADAGGSTADRPDRPPRRRRSSRRERNTPGGSAPFACQRRQPPPPQRFRIGQRATATRPLVESSGHAEAAARRRLSTTAHSTRGCRVSRVSVRRV